MPPLDSYGYDHWSLLLFMETCVVDHGGKIKDPFRMRTKFYASDNELSYHTRMKGGAVLLNHDDWDCLQNLIDAKLVTAITTADGEIFGLTNLGWSLARGLHRLIEEHRPLNDFQWRLYA